MIAKFRPCGIKGPNTARPVNFDSNLAIAPAICGLEDGGYPEGSNFSCADAPAPVVGEAGVKMRRRVLLIGVAQ